MYIRRCSINQSINAIASAMFGLYELQLPAFIRVTVNDDTDPALMRHFRVVGPPTIMIFGPDGEEYRAQRTVG